ncbi:MAG: YrdB family protein [Devosia sp.]
MLSSLKNGNLALAFAVEIAMLAGFAVAGWASTPILWLRIVLMVALPAIAILMWAVWAAPKAKKRRLKPGPLLVFKIIIFGFATLAWWLAGMGLIAAILGVMAAINLLGIAAFRQY